jgi:hypothetical protein
MGNAGGRLPLATMWSKVSSGIHLIDTDMAALNLVKQLRRQFASALPPGSRAAISKF